MGRKKQEREAFNCCLTGRSAQGSVYQQAQPSLIALLPWKLAASFLFLRISSENQRSGQICPPCSPGGFQREQKHSTWGPDSWRELQGSVCQETKDVVSCARLTFTLLSTSRRCFSANRNQCRQTAEPRVSKCIRKRSFQGRGRARHE